MWPFFKSVLFGTLVGAALPLCLTVPLGILNLLEPLTGHRDFIGSLYFAALPLIVAFAVVLPSSVLVGIPVSLVLKKLDAESTDFYVLCGAAFGILITLLVLVLIRAQAGYWMVILGAFSGAATAWNWSRYRSRA